MENFKQLYENRLREMPYVDLPNKETFDLELENFKSAKEVLDFLENIIEGNFYKDKYGATVHLKSDKEKKQFIESLKVNTIFINIIKHKFSLNEKKLLDMLFKFI